jgi:hypothetical protein
VGTGIKKRLNTAEIEDVFVSVVTLECLIRVVCLQAARNEAEETDA